jgi:thiol-disulfide isomerase/thioredoxin
MNLSNYFDQALAYEDYINMLSQNLSLHRLHYKKFTLNEKASLLVKQLDPYKILVITEPWCGDSLAILPVVKKIAEQGIDWEIRVVRRDENPDLMEKYLTKGARAIPIFLFIDEAGDFRFKWGPRPRAAQGIYDSYRDLIRGGKISKADVIKKIHQFYAQDHGNTILSELMHLLRGNKN